MVCDFEFTLLIYIFVTATWWDKKELVVPIWSLSGMFTAVCIHMKPGLKPMVDVISFMGRKNLFLRRRRVRNRFCATISLVRNLSNHFRRPMLHLNSLMGTAPGHYCAIKMCCNLKNMFTKIKLILRFSISKMKIMLTECHLNADKHT